MRITVVYLLFFITFSLFNACDRSQSEKSKVLLTLPSVSSSASFSNSVATINSVNALNDWAPIIPTGFNGDQPVNCYFVAVSGPDPILQNRSCYKTISSSTGSSNQILFNYGHIAGPLPQGQTIELEVPSGPDRVFRVFASHASSLAECKPGFSKEGFSKPYLLGEMGRVNLLPSIETTVSIPVSFDSNQYVDGCDLVAPPPTPIAPPSSLVVEMINPLFGEQVYDGQCVPVNVSITDSSGLITFMNSSDLTLGFRTNTATDYNSYLDFYRCSNSISADNTFVFRKNTFKEKRWLKVDSGWIGAVSMGINPNPTTLSIKPVPISRQAVGTTQTNLANIPDYIKNDTCYPIVFSKRSLDSSSDMSIASVDFTFTTQLSGAGAITFHNINNCTDAGITSLTTGPYSSIAADIKYFRASNVPIGSSINFKITNTATSSDQTNYTAKLKGGSDLANRFKIKGPTEIKRHLLPLCHGPFRLFLTNEIDSESVNNLTTNRNFRFLYNDATVQIYPFPGCSVGQISSSNVTGTTHLSIPPGATSKEFYLKVSSTAISGDRTITVFDDERGLNYFYKVFINVP